MRLILITAYDAMKRVSQELNAAASAAAAADSAVALSSSGLGMADVGDLSMASSSCGNDPSWLRRRMEVLNIKLRNLGDKSFEVNTFLLQNNHMALLGNMGKFLDEDGSSSAAMPGDQWCVPWGGRGTDCLPREYPPDLQRR